ncbi:MAG: hypothetical protein ACKVI1_09855 [Flavobacteriales bacterium]|jgi:hypothetical protein
MLRSIFYIVLVWVVWRWLDRMFGNRRRKNSIHRPGGGSRPTSNSNSKNKKPNDDRIGDYVDFEEVED